MRTPYGPALRRSGHTLTVHITQVRGFVEECDRRIRAAQRRLEKTPEENNRTTALVRPTILMHMYCVADTRWTAQMREIGEIEGAYQAALAAVESLGTLALSSCTYASLTSVSQQDPKERSTNR